MSTSTLITPPAPSAVDNPPTFRQMLEEILPVIGVVLVAGPPVILLVGPLVLFALVLVGPFALIATSVLVVGVALIAAAVLVELTRAIAAASHLLVRPLPARRRRHAASGAPSGHPVALKSRDSAA